MDYKKAGVDIEAGREFISEIKDTVDKTHSSNVLNGIGGFGGLFKFPIENYKKPILVSGADGVGTKLELAQKYNYHFEVGIDLVAMCLNDITTTGAVPLFFLDYIATGKLDKKKLKEIIQGIAKSCSDNNCSLLGGETAEMPGFYANNKYDLAGFCVGVVDQENLVNGDKIIEDDLIIALESNGIHSNGFSLVRKIIQNCKNIDKKFQDFTNLNFYDQILKPTRIYNNLIKELLEKNIEIKGMSHITGGGILENLPRCIPEGFLPHLDTESWDLPIIFKFLKDVGQVPESDLWNTFNLGVGFCLVVNKKYVKKILEISASNRINSWVIGKIQKKNELNKNQIISGIKM